MHKFCIKNNVYSKSGHNIYTVLYDWLWSEVGFRFAVTCVAIKIKVPPALTNEEMWFQVKGREEKESCLQNIEKYVKYIFQSAC